MRVDLQRARPGADELAALVIGPSGNLRAPALRAGRRLAVGFDREALAALLA